MEKIRICFVSTSPEMVSSIIKATESHHDLDVRHINSTFGTSLDATRRFCGEFKAEAILSLRGTAATLAKNFDIPVIGISTSTNDILRTLTSISQGCDHKSFKVIITLFNKQRIDIDILKGFFNIDIYVLRYKNEFDLKRGMIKAKKQGYEIALGGGATMQIAKKLGIAGYLVLPSLSQIDMAFENAKNVVLGIRKDRIEMERDLQILNSVGDGIISVDANGIIQMMNDKAMHYLQLSQLDIGKPFIDVFKQATLHDVAQTGKSVLAKIISVGTRQFVVNQRPIVIEGKNIGAVGTICPFERVLKTAKIAQTAISRGFVTKYTLKDFRFTDHKMQKIIEKAYKYAATDSSILLFGETGTGKEILAHGIHAASPRKNGPFVSVNCSALPETLLESELFGYESGAFTGSKKAGKVGLFEMADNGTIFLDEINSMPITVQNVLLRVLQDKEIRRIGGQDLLKIDVRVIAATNRNMIEEINAGRLKLDLYFRLNVLNIELPPLRDHKDDIAFLLKFFLNDAHIKNNTTLINIPDDQIERLKNLPWFGNTRELQHFAERMSILMSSSGFNAEIYEELLKEMYISSKTLTFANQSSLGKSSHDMATHNSMKLSRKDILDAIDRASGKKSLAANILGISRSTLWRAITKMGLQNELAK